MEKQQLLRLFGAAVAIIMVVSMFAIAILYNTSNEPETNFDVDQSLQPTAFAYDVSFDTQVMQELSALRFSAFTTELDLQEIDRSILEMGGVRKVDSWFQATGDENWAYLAEITTKKGHSIEEIVGQIGALEYFSGEYDAIKYITIATPDGPVLLTNETLGIDKNFTFETGTVSAIAMVSTQEGDSISVTGSISLRGNAIQTLELYELINYTQLEAEILDTNVPVDDNLFDVVVDENTLADGNTLE